MMNSYVKQFRKDRDKICLISYTGQGGEKMGYFPLGIASISAALKQAGYNVKMVDYDVRLASGSSMDDLYNEISAFDMIGFSAKSGTSLAFSLDAIERIKAVYPDKMVVVGGPLVTAEPERFLSETKADFIVTGEGEEAVVKLMAALEIANVDEVFDRLSVVPGIGFCKDGHVIIRPFAQIADIDSLPMPDFESFDLNRYTNYQFAYTDFGGKNITLFTSRGCPFDCQFCTHVFGKKWRGQSAQKIYETMKYLKERHGVVGFMIMDDNFMHSKERTNEFCKLAKTLGVKWACESRASSIREDIVREMKEAGCIAIRMGFESGSERVLRLMKKGVTLKQSYDAVECLVRSGYPILGGFMFGVPGETKEDVKETLKFIRHIYKISPVSKVWSYFYTPRPANPWYNLSVSKGMKPLNLRDWAMLDKYKSGGAFKMSNLSDKQIKKLMFKINLYTFLASKGKLKILFRKDIMKMGIKTIKGLVLGDRRKEAGSN